MKHIKLLVFFIASTVLLAQGQTKQENKSPDTFSWGSVPKEVSGIKQSKIDLNGKWKFNPAPQGSFWKKYRVNDWKEINVPGEWLMQGFEVEPNSKAAYFKEFNVPADWKNKSIYLRCDAVFSKANIWVNGKSAGRHIGPMLAFELEVTELLKYGSSNKLAIGITAETMSDTLMSGTQYAAHQLGGILRKIYEVSRIIRDRYQLKLIFSKRNTISQH